MHTLVQEGKDARDKYAKYIVHHAADIVLVFVRDKPKEIEQIHKLGFSDMMDKRMDQSGYVRQHSWPRRCDDACERAACSLAYNHEAVQCRQGHQNLLCEWLKFLNPCRLVCTIRIVVREAFGDGAESQDQVMHLQHQLQVARVSGLDTLLQLLRERLRNQFEQHDLCIRHVAQLRDKQTTRVKEVKLAVKC